MDYFVEREQYLLSRLGELEGCEDDPVHEKEIARIIRELSNLLEGN